MGKLTQQIVALATATPPPDALDVMSLSIIDWIACGIAGQKEPVAQVLATLLDEEGGTAQATCFGGARRPARAAALYNGTVSHALDYDDTHFAHIGHISVGVLPAALAMAERNDATLGQFVRAGLAGCEAAVRMGIALGRDHYQIGFHQTATAGTFGATLAADLLNSADPTTQAHALGLASTRAAGLKSQFGTMGKPYNAGIAASTGVEAAILAGNGMVSDPNGWDGPGGFIATHHGAGGVQPDGFLMPQVSHKFHSCCHGLHAALEAVATLAPMDADQITAIEVVTHPRWMSVCNKPDPRTGLEAKFSYKAVLAFAALGHPTAALATFDDAKIGLPKVQALMRRVTVSADAALSEMQAQLTLVTAQGAVSAFYDLDAPQPVDVRRAKIMAKASAMIGQGRTMRIADALATQPDMPIRDFVVHTIA